MNVIITLANFAVSEVANLMHITLKGTEIVLSAEPIFQTALPYAMFATKKFTIWRVSNAEPSDKGVD